MVRCPHCGCPVSDGEAVCPICGKSMTAQPEERKPAAPEQDAPRPSFPAAAPSQPAQSPPETLQGGNASIARKAQEAQARFKKMRTIWGIALALTLVLGLAFYLSSRNMPSESSTRTSVEISRDEIPAWSADLPRDSAVKATFTSVVDDFGVTETVTTTDRQIGRTTKSGSFNRYLVVKDQDGQQYILKLTTSSYVSDTGMTKTTDMLKERFQSGIWYDDYLFVPSEGLTAYGKLINAKTDFNKYTKLSSSEKQKLASISDYPMIDITDKTLYRIVEDPERRAEYNRQQALMRALLIGFVVCLLVTLVTLRLKRKADREVKVCARQLALERITQLNAEGRSTQDQNR